MNSFKCSSQSLLDFYEEDRLLLEVVEEIEKELSAQNQVVCQFLIDSKPLTSGNEGQLSNKMLSQVNSIEYQVADLMSLVKEVAEGWMAAIDEQIEPIFDLAEEMVERSTHKSFLRLEQVFDWCGEFVESISTMKIHRSSSMALELLEWDKLEAKLSDTVRELLHKSEKKDFKGVAYVLEYDLVEILQGWNKELGRFVAQIRRIQEGNGTHQQSPRTATDFFVHNMGRSRSVN